MSGGTLAVYQQIDAIEVVPSYGIARVGGGRIDRYRRNSKPWPRPSCRAGRCCPRAGRGPMDDRALDAEAKRTEDEKFAGHFDRRGRFVPAGAGPNPAREYSGDNVGNLTVVAQAQDGTRAVEGKAHLIVTVQRWNTPPIY